MKNLSLGGLALESKTKIPLGTELTVNLRDCAISGTTVWARGHDSYGVKFHTPTWDQEQSLRRILNTELARTKLDWFLE